MRTMTVDQVISLFGTQSALAEKIGVVQSAIANWKVRGIPATQFKPLLDAAKREGIKLTADQLLAVPRPKARKRAA